MGAKLLDKIFGQRHDILLQVAVFPDQHHPDPAFEGVGRASASAWWPLGNGDGFRHRALCIFQPPVWFHIPPQGTHQPEPFEQAVDPEGLDFAQAQNPSGSKTRPKSKQYQNHDQNHQKCHHHFRNFHAQTALYSMVDPVNRGKNDRPADQQNNEESHSQINGRNAVILGGFLAHRLAILLG